MDKYFLSHVCTHKKCEGFDKPTEKVHIEKCSNSVMKVRVISKDPRYKGKEMDLMLLVLTQSICPFCSRKMEVFEREETDITYLKSKYSAIPEDAKKSRDYYTRWESKEGGRPKYNPNSENGGNGGGKIDIRG